MSSFITKIRKACPGDLLTDTELMQLYTGTPARRHGIVKRALARGDLLRIKRGLYCLSEPHRSGSLNLHALAQYIHGPSYISLESALSYHGLLPEAVYASTSVSSKRARSFQKCFGLFIYHRVPCRPFFTGVDRNLIRRRGS